VPSALMIASLSEVLLLPTLMIGEKLPDFVAEVEKPENTFFS
jgi:hypothetical protein